MLCGRFIKTWIIISVVAAGRWLFPGGPRSDILRHTRRPRFRSWEFSTKPYLSTIFCRRRVRYVYSAPVYWFLRHPPRHNGGKRNGIRTERSPRREGLSYQRDKPAGEIVLPESEKLTALSKRFPIASITCRAEGEEENLKDVEP